VVATGLGLAAGPARAWWPEGHSIIASGAVKALPSEVPQWFREGGGMIAHCAQDPDLVKSRSLPELNDTEGPEHYLDFELLAGKPLPANRYIYLKLCADMKLNPNKVGTLPYSVTEWTQRVTMAFAENRKYPENPYVKSKALVYAGILAHYAGDLSMPLHCTVDYNGRAKPDGTSPSSGIHAKVDSLVEKCELKPEELAADQKPEAVDDIMLRVLEEIQASRKLIDKTYELEPKLPPESGEWKPSPEVLAFTKERARAGTRFLSSLYLTAWRKSERLQLPAWLKREAR
jgi:hypothetical protein